MLLSASIPEEANEEMLNKYFIMYLDITKFPVLNSCSEYAVTTAICIVYVIIFLAISNTVAWCLSLVSEQTNVFLL